MDDLRQKIAQAMEQEFVGNFVFSDEEISQMFEFAGTILRNYDTSYGNSISQGYDEWLFVAMVNTIKTWNSDEDSFWECIFKKLLGYSNSQKVYLHLTKVIERLGSAKKIFYLDGCTKRYYATILAHAYAPQNSTESFLELCWKLYSQDMNFTYTKNDEIFVLVAEELRVKFSNEKSIEDDFKLGGDVYSLRAGIKRMAIDAPDLMTHYIENTVSMLNRAFEGEIFDNNQYYNTIVRKWWAHKEVSFGIEKPRRRSYERAITDYSAIRPKYSYNGEHTVLKIPSIRLKDNFYDNPVLNIYRNRELVDSIEMLTFGSGLTMATKEKSLFVDNLISEDGKIEFTLEIQHCGQVIYNSNKTLFREYIIFKDQREMMQDECLPGNYLLYISDFDSLSSFPDTIKKKDYNLYVFYAEENEFIQSEKRTVFFVREKSDREIKIIADKKNNAKFIHNGEEFIVIDGDLKVVVKSSTDISKYGIRYETSDFKLKEFTFDETEGLKCFYITELLNVCEPQKINVFSYVDNKIVASYNVVKFNSINISFDKSLYFDEFCVGTVRFLTEKYDKTVTFDINDGDIVIPFDDGDIVLTPPILKWRIDDGESTHNFVDNLWYKNLSNSADLNIELPTEMGYKVYLNNGAELAESSKFNAYKLGETVYSMLDEKTQISVFLKVEGVDIIPICSIALKETFRYSPVEFVGNVLIWNPNAAFVGDENANFAISLMSKGQVVYEQKTTLAASRFSLQDVEIGYYTVVVNLIKGGFLKQVVKLYEDDFIYGDINKIRFKGKALKFERVMLMGKAKTDDIVPFYVDHLWYIVEEDGCHYYPGSAYFVNKNGYKTYLNTMPNSDGGIDDINPVRIELRSDNSCFIVAGANSEDIHDFLGEFTLDTRNRISNFDRNTRGIDYYFFETEEV